MASRQGTSGFLLADPDPASPEDRVLRVMVERIVSGELPARAPLHQVALAEEFGVNRHQIREVLKSLATDRLVRLRPYASATVAPLSARDFQELHELRIALEASVVRRALPRITRADYLAMRSCLDVLAEAPEASAARLRAHERFHRLLYQRADRPWIVALVDRSRLLSRRYLAVLHDAIGWPSTNATHERILDAVDRADAAALEELIADHGREAHEPIFQYLSRFEIDDEEIGA